jgi:formylglycine-generating enzyme required for sulfatase activity
MLGDSAWFSGNGEGKSHPVGTKQPNAWGLHDMHGNVWEWCSDLHGGNLQGGLDPVGPAVGSNRVSRGGSWGDQPIRCRSVSRISNEPSYRSVNLGFRVVRGLLVK